MQSSPFPDAPLATSLVVGAAVMGLALAIQRQQLTESLPLEWVLFALLVGAAALLALVSLRWLRRWQRREVVPAVQALFSLREPVAPVSPQPLDQSLSLLGQDWLRAGSVSLLAGPRVLPLRRVVEELVASGLDVWVVGAALGGNRRIKGLGRVRFSAEAEDGSTMAAWSREVLAQGRRPVLVVFPEEGLRDERLAERVETRMGRLCDELEFLGKEGLRVIFLWQTDPDRVLVPDEVGQRGLKRIDAMRMWNGRRALAPVDPPGLALTTALARWLVSPGASLAWNRPNQRAAAWAAATGAGVLYGLGAIAVCAAVFLGDPRDQRLLGDVDASLVGSLWGNWWVAEAIRQGRPLDMFTSDLAYWPDGASLIAIFGNVLPNLLSLPFQFVLGYPGYWNIFVLVSLVANGLAMRALARRLGADRSGALVAGAVFAFSPALVAEVSAGHQVAFQAFGLPLALWAGLGTLDGHGRRREWLTALCLMAACLGWWIYGAIAWGLLLVFGWSRWRYGGAERRAELVGKLGRVFRLWLPTLLFAFPLLASANARKLPGLWWGSFPHELEGDMLADIVVHELITESLRPASLLLGDPGEAFGWLPALMGAGVLITWGASPFRTQRFWPVLAGGLLVAAMGPYLQPSADGLEGWTPLPGALLFYALPGFSRLHHPDRLLIVVGLCLAVMVGLLWHWALRLAWKRGSALPAFAAVAVCAALPYFGGDSPVAVTRFEAPTFYDVLGDEGAIVELPIGYREETLLYQPYHGLPRLGGPGEKWRAANPKDPFHLKLRLDPFLRFLWDPGAPPPMANSVLEVREEGLRYVVVHLGWIRELAQLRFDNRIRALLEHMERVDTLLGPPIYRSSQVTIYRVPDGQDADEKVLAFMEAEASGGASGGSVGGGSVGGGSMGGGSMGGGSMGGGSMGGATGQ